ncbi:response regulator [Mucilaginibacter sp. S1162]|uniref:Response regulator n=1 Tax=Mucilaginibacter humi TaxID=2732510 RepID=A0ABX1W1E6_9SPHI|nr:response regulator [Mucilaginibacter humi]NNU34059.1 response regulator [Mucilaginibacter humi]
MDGQKAIKAVIEHDYDVILMDINMPIMDGFEAAKQIRHLPLPHKNTIPIIAVTASIGAAIDRVSQNPFIDDCLLKPFNPEHLRDKLMEIAGRNVMK